MNALLDPTAAERLAKLCGMFGSHHVGERATAAALADKLVREQGLTWGDVILPKATDTSIEDLIDFAVRNGAGVLDPWQKGFLRGIRGRQHLTEKQLAKLDEIVDLVSRRAAA